MMGRVERIASLSHSLCWITGALAHGMPLVVAGAILPGWSNPAQVLARFPQVPPGTPVSALQVAAVAGLAVLSVFALVAAFLPMRRLFGRCLRTEILTDACAADIVHIGQALFAVAAVTVLVHTAQLLVLNCNPAPGGHILSIGTDGSTMGFLLSGAALIVIGWMMRKAARAAEEIKSIV